MNLDGKRLVGGFSDIKCIPLFGTRNFPGRAKKFGGILMENLAKYGYFLRIFPTKTDFFKRLMVNITKIDRKFDKSE